MTGASPSSSTEDGHPLRFNLVLARLVETAGESSSGYRRFTKACELAETLGFDGVWASHGNTRPDPIALMTHVISVSETLRTGTGVFLLSVRHPAAVALELATIDQISEGRLIFGVGAAGDRGNDLTINGVKSSERGRRMDESLAVLRALWAGEEVHHEGKYYAVDGRLMVRPYQETIPILMGARGGRTPARARVYDRVVNAGQGWLPYIMTPELYAHGMQEIKARGGGPDLIYGLVEMTNVGSGDGLAAIETAVANQSRAYAAAGAPAGASADRFRPLLLAGNAQACAERLIKFVDLGVTEFVLSWACDPGQEEDQMRRLAGDVLPIVKAHAAQRARG
jgi:alkanesulfonate monooxygenase SsuD/methylene tetrahydromethanopterin reductase-like flavin-dependent oxidoreductase (luciferase family)